MNKRSAVFLAAIILGTLGVPTGAQSYPDKPICLVVSYASGMQTDAVACQTTVKLPELLGQQIVIDPPGTGVKNFIQIPFIPDGVNHGYIKIRINDPQRQYHLPSSEKHPAYYRWIYGPDRLKC